MKFSFPGTLYAVVDPCDAKSVTARLPAGTTAVPVSAAEVIVPLVVVVYVKVVVVGTDTIVYVPCNAEFPFVPAMVTDSPTAKLCAVEVVIVAVEPVRAEFDMVFESSPCHV